MSISFAFPFNGYLFTSIANHFPSPYLPAFWLNIDIFQIRKVRDQKKIPYSNIIYSVLLKIYLNIFRGTDNFHEITMTLAFFISKIRRSESMFYKFFPSLTLPVSKIKAFGLFRLYHGYFMDILTICFICLWLYPAMNGKIFLLKETFVSWKSW